MPKLFVANFPFDVEDPELFAHFKRFGATDAEVIFYAENGRPAGYGYVTIPDPAQAAAAIKALDGTDYRGRRLGVETARQKRRAA
jgi:cold-inducible RNA-binding protein